MPVEVASGESGYEIYELRPWRLDSWRPGLYFGLGMYYADAEPSGKVNCELLTSHNWGRNWTRLAPRQQFIAHGAAGSFDDHTCYAATPLSVPRPIPRRRARGLVPCARARARFARVCVCGRRASARGGCRGARARTNAQ